MIGKITTPGVRKISRITPSQFAYATNQKISCSTPATAIISVTNGRSVCFITSPDKGVLATNLTVVTAPHHRAISTAMSSGAIITSVMFLPQCDSATIASATFTLIQACMRSTLAITPSGEPQILFGQASLKRPTETSNRSGVTLCRHMFT